MGRKGSNKVSFKVSSKPHQTLKSKYNTNVAGLRRVLLVDDEPLVGRHVERILGPDWILVTATDAMEAVRLLGKGRFHTVITDYDMLGPDGLWLLRWMERACPNTRRVLYSGSNIPGIVSHLSSKLIQHFIVKPATKEEFHELFNTENKS